MSQHPHVATVDRMTGAVLGGDREVLDELLTDDFTFHYRGPYPKPGDYAGAAGLMEVIGAVVEATGGDVDLQQRFCVPAGEWVSEWEHAVLGRRGRRLESDNAFVYRFADDRIAEMWMFIGAPPGSEEFFA
ncbi:nuclear transport factor 2 family protein [Geodermatophilus sp. SYSU D00684]